MNVPVRWSGGISGFRSSASTSTSARNWCAPVIWTKTVCLTITAKLSRMGQEFRRSMEWVPRRRNLVNCRFRRSDPRPTSPSQFVASNRVVDRIGVRLRTRLRRIWQLRGSGVWLCRSLRSFRDRRRKPESAPGVHGSRDADLPSRFRNAVLPPSSVSMALAPLGSQADLRCSPWSWEPSQKNTSVPTRLLWICDRLPVYEFANHTVLVWKLDR